MKIKLAENWELYCTTIDEEGYDFFDKMRNFVFSDEIPIITEYPICPSEINGKCMECPLADYCEGSKHIGQYNGPKCFHVYLPEIEEYIASLNFVLPIEFEIV